MKKLMRHIKHFGLVFLLCNSIYLQGVTFQPYNENTGTRINNLYKWAGVKQCNTVITYNRSADLFTVDDTKYEVLIHPEHYIVRQHYKFIMMQAIDDSYNKVCIKIFFYDNGKKCVSVLGEKIGMKYWCY